MSLNIRPIGNRVVIEEIEAERKRNGILLPDSHKTDMLVGEVVAVGPGTMTVDGSFVPCQVVVGDKVNIPRLNTDEIEIYGKPYLITLDNKITYIEPKAPFVE